MHRRSHFGECSLSSPSTDSIDSLMTSPTTTATPSSFSDESQQSLQAIPGFKVHKSAHFNAGCNMPKLIRNSSMVTRHPFKKRRKIKNAMYLSPHRGHDIVVIFFRFVFVVAVFLFTVLVLLHVFDPFLPSTSSTQDVESRKVKAASKTSTNTNKHQRDYNIFKSLRQIHDRDRPPLRPSDLYEIPSSLSHIGDKSDGYALLRKEYDEAFPEDPIRSMQVAQELRQYPDLKTRFKPSRQPAFNVQRANDQDGEHHKYEKYDIYNCPSTPPPGYPIAWLTQKILGHWPPDQVEPPQDGKLYQSICVFDYERDYDKAMNYRKLEVPFVVRNDPRVAQSVERWNSENYLERMLGPNVEHETEYSDSNHFLYWLSLFENSTDNGKVAQKKKIFGEKLGRKRPEGWNAPTKKLKMTYRQWLEHANTTDPRLLGPNKPHWYYRLIGCGELSPRGDCEENSSEYLFDEFPFFQPRSSESLYMVEPSAQNGIHCRFGMQGVIAENHYDGGRNAIVIMGGARRYILSHPNQCSRLALYPKSHPSARHSMIDWSQVASNSTYSAIINEKFPTFEKARSTEVVLQAGDVLYLPTHWFHFIVSLTLNYQCNTRSGKGVENLKAVKKCGF